MTWARKLGKLIVTFLVSWSASVIYKDAQKKYMGKTVSVCSPSGPERFRGKVVGITNPDWRDPWVTVMSTMTDVQKVPVSLLTWTPEVGMFVAEIQDHEGHET